VYAAQVYCAPATGGKSELFTLDHLRAAGAEVTSNAYPDADAVVVDGWEQVRYNADGTSRSVEDVCYKVLTEKGRRELRTLSFFYDVAYGTVVVTKLEIIKPDGAVTPVDLAQQARDMTETSQMSMNIYDPNLKTLKVSVPGLEIGDLVRCAAQEIITKARVPNTWAEIAPLEDTKPIRSYKYEVLAPKARLLKHTALKNPVGGTVTFTQMNVAAGVVYRWSARDVPRVYPEPGMPGLNSIQHLLLSTISDWPTLSRWYYNLSEPRLRAVTPAMSNEVKRLIAKASTPREKTEAIFKHVSQKIRYMGVTMEDTAPGYEPHDVCITFNNKYGVCRDKAALLVAMLRIAGLKAYPVLIHFDIKKDAVVPEPYFNHAITAVEETDGSYILMDSTDENTRELLPAYLNNKSYLVATPNGDTLRTTPVVPAEENLARITTRARYAPDGALTLNSRVQFLGLNDNAYRGGFAQLDFDQIRRYFEGSMKDVLPGSVLTEFEIQPDDMMDLSQPISVRMSCTAPDMLISGRRMVMLPVPWLGSRFGLLDAVLRATGLETRRYPLVTDIACGVREVLTLDVGEAAGPLVALPRYDAVSSDLLDWQRSMSAAGTKLSATQVFLIHAVEFSTNQYAQLKDALRTIESQARKRPLYRRGDRGDDERYDDDGIASSYEYVPAEDVQFISIKSDYTLSNAQTWTAVESIEKKILTYAGKKQNAELKIHYNPAWEDVRLVAARVTDVDGQDHIVSAEEINLMDAGWVASAPRYPAGKILVVSLPGVDIDSEVSYQIERTCRNRPFFSAREYFTSFDPIDEKTVTVRAPQAVALNVCVIKEDEIEAAREEEDGKVRYAWSSSDQRAVRKEDALPPWYSFNPTVFVSAGSWKEYAAQVHAALERAAADQPAAAERGRALAAGAADAAAKLLAVRDFAAMHIRAAGPAFDELPLSALTPADITLRDGYGNSADRAILLAALLRAAGFEPQFVLASLTPRVPGVIKPLAACPQLTTFDSVLVRVELGGEAIYLNDTDQYAALGSTRHDGRLGLLLPEGITNIIRAAAGKEERDETAYTVALDADGTARITQRSIVRGTSFGEVKRQFAEMQPEERRQVQEQLVSAIAQAAQIVTPLSASFDAYPGVVELTVTVPRYAVRDDTRLYFTLPADLGALLRLRSDMRDNPLYWSEPRRAVTSIEMQLPEGFTDADVLPPAVKWNAPAGAGTVIVSTERADGSRTLTLNHAVDLQPAVIDADDYVDVLQINRTLAHPRMKTVLVTQPE